MAQLNKRPSAKQDVRMGVAVDIAEFASLENEEHNRIKNKQRNQDG